LRRTLVVEPRRRGWAAFALKARGVTIHVLRAAADALDALPDQPTEATERLCVEHKLA
jgi:hypothetical protein